ncbi:hypothetical protein Tco_0125557 [Tanacetum coccineum]
MAEYSQKWHNGTSRGRITKTSDRLAAIQAQLNNLGREIKKVNEKFMLLKLDANNAKDPITSKIAHKRRRENPRRSLLHAIWNNTNPSYQERRQSMEDTLRKFMNESTKRHEENSKTLEIQIGQMSKSRQTTVHFPSHLDNRYYEEEEGNYGPKFTKAYGASHINNAIPQKEKDPGSFTLPCFINDVCFNNALVD